MTSGAGRVLGGRYTLLTPIAQGGMGEVWKARDRVSGHIVAAKVLRPELAGEELSLSRLRLEARNSMSISHPNIANTQDSGEEDGIGWIIMELVDGYPLTDYLRGGSRIEPEYLMPILVQVAMALGAAARAGVVHRDIKPANIIVRPDGMVKLTDFGISRATGQVNLTAAGMVMGTAQYLPPEQAMGEVATPIGDLYALGVIAYEAAAGRRPFTGETQVDIAFAHVNDPVPPLPDFVPEPLADVILHLLEKDPAKRPESGSAAVREIASAAKAMGVSVTPRPLPLPKAAQRPEEVRTPVQPSVPIVAPVRHLTRRTLPDEMLQPPSGLTPKVRATTGRHAAVPHILDEAEVPPVSRPVSAPAAPAPAQAAVARPTTGSIPRHAAPARSEQVPQPSSEKAQRPQASAPAQRPAPIPAPPTGAAPAHTAAPKTPLPSEPQDRRAALAERLRQREAARQAEDAAEEQRRAAVAREEEQRQRELQEARERREAEEAKRQAARQAAPRIPQPTRSDAPRRDKAATASTPRVYGTVPQPRTATPSKRQRRSVYEPRPEKGKRGPRWHELNARSAQRTRPAAKTAYSRSVVAPPVPASRQIIRAIIVAIIVIALIALAAITIKNILGSLIQPSAGAHIIEEVRTWQSPWPTV